ncbi:hypothetical protein LBMAG42_48740 [Deltaproteobacteria bacterium]|nr:hypothetical protein LBMAG42_48740 [Deltaproteobacteria bacterium]
MGFAAILAVATLLVLEGLAHVLAAPSPQAGAWRADAEAEGGILLDGSPWFLWELRPGVHQERGVTVSVNTLGMRGPEVGPKSGPRVLALGDSSIYGFGVADDAVFTSRLAVSPEVEVINGGVPGYSTFQSLNLLDARGLALEPDLLLVGNLWSDNNFDTFVDRELLAAYSDWRGSRTGAIRGVLERSALFRWVDWFARVRGQAESARRVGWTVGGGGDPTGRRRVALQDYAANLYELASRMEARGGAVAFILLANRDDILHRTPNPAWGPYREVMRQTAASWGAPLVDAPAAFQASGLDVDALFLDVMHPTAAGHQVLADAIAAALAGWPERRIDIVDPGVVPVIADPFLHMEAPVR